MGIWAMQVIHSPMCQMSGSPWSSWDPGSVWGRRGARCWHTPHPRGCPEPHPGLCLAPLHAEQAAILPCVTARRGGCGHGCAGSERPGDRVQPRHRTGACAAARRQPPAPPAHICHLPRPQGSKREGQCGHREWDGAEPGGQWGSAVHAALLPLLPWLGSPAVGAGVLWGSHNLPSPLDKAAPNVAGWDEAGEADMSSALAPGCANGQPTPFLCWDHSGWEAVPKPSSTILLLASGLLPYPICWEGPFALYTKKAKPPWLSDLGAGVGHLAVLLMASNLLPCSITLFPGPARISCPARQHQTGPARYGATFLLAPNIASNSLLTSEVGPRAAFPGSSSPDRWGGIHGEGSMHT